MKRTRAITALAATALAVGGLTVAAAQPAAASDAPGWLCITNSPTPQYAGFLGYGGIDHQLTHSQGRGFRVHHVTGGTGMADWAYGHGAQYPNHDGWVRYDRLNC